MKTALVFALVVAAIAVSVDSQQCEKGCLGSSDCATTVGDLHCRCTNLKCGLIEGNCGGGCINDEQCAKWAENDTTCVCVNLICRRPGDLVSESETKYTRFNHFQALLKSPSMRQKFIEANDYAKVAHLAK